ncbi:MAG: endonuclease III domain-containing protein [Thermodesulfobacteriota bacterium]
MSAKELQNDIYGRLLASFGPRHWWPADSPFEVIAGAILTQNTAWRNVSQAIDNLKRAGCLSPRKIRELTPDRLAGLIHPAGYHNLKARRLKNFVDFLYHDYQGSLNHLLGQPVAKLRAELLELNGIGPETADSIILYAACQPVFVIDAYTRRILSRHGLIAADASYQSIQSFFHANLPADHKLFNEYHALLVELGKRFCRKVPQCQGCPLEYLLPPARE